MGPTFFILFHFLAGHHHLVGAVVVVAVWRVRQRSLAVAFQVLAPIYLPRLCTRKIPKIEANKFDGDAHLLYICHVRCLFSKTILRQVRNLFMALSLSLNSLWSYS